MRLMLLALLLTLAACDAPTAFEDPTGWQPEHHQGFEDPTGWHPICVYPEHAACVDDGARVRCDVPACIVRGEVGEVCNEPASGDGHGWSVARWCE